MAKNNSFLVEIWNFLKIRKMWWLAPIILLLIIAGLVIVGFSSAFSIRKPRGF